MVKQITWDDQWIGYDDVDTIAKKMAFANDRCLGGTMVWSIDFDSGAGSGDIPDGGATNSTSSSGGTGTGSGLVYVDPVIWTKPSALVQCQPPCVLVLPPSPLPSPSTISFPPFTTSFVIQSIIIQGGSTVTSEVTAQTTISVPPVTSTAIEVWAITVFSQDTTLATFSPVQSVTPLSFAVTLPGSEAAPPFPTPTVVPTSTTTMLVGNPLPRHHRRQLFQSSSFHPRT